MSRAITTIDASALGQRLPPVRWLIEQLGIAPGAATCVAGYGYSGKTLAMQDAALAIATGTQVWGVYSARRGRVLHLDYEQGRRLTSERYQRLAKGRGIALCDVGDALRVGVHPTVYLDDGDASDVYARAMEGCDLVVVDSLRASVPSADENSSEVRRHIDVLSRASEKTNAVVVFIHHARKPQADQKGGGKVAIRGSSAIFDACSSVFVFDGKKGKPARISHEKCRNRGTTVDDFELRIEDIEIDGDDRGGLRVVHSDSAPLPSAEREQRDLRVEAAVRACVNEQPGIAGTEAIRVSVGLSANAVRAAVRELETTGAIENRGSASRPRYFLNEAT